MQDFSYKDIDQEGLDTLMAISGADAFNKWMYEATSPFLKGSILEIGSGIGNISSQFILRGKTITLSDIRSNYIRHLQTNFQKEATVKDILHLDLVENDFSSTHQNLLSAFDSLFALNVVEHIKDDELAIQNAASLLKPGGSMVILVPANQWMYNSLDKDLYHYRRYSSGSLSKLMLQAGLNVQKSFYFNALGTAGWIISGSIFKNRIIKPGQMNLFNKMVPLARLIDKITRRFYGLSVVVVAQKPL